MKNSYACYGTFPYLIVSTSLAGRVSDGTDDRWFLSVARDCLFFKVSRLSLEGTQPSVEGKRGGLPRESNRSEAWSGILAFTSVEVESAWSFTTRPLLLHGVVLNKVPAQLTVPYALPINVFIYIYIYIYPNFVMQTFCCVLVRHRISHRYEIVRRVTVVVQFLGYLSTALKITCCWRPHPVGKR